MSLKLYVYYDCRAIKFYKHVVQSVEKFIQKCKPEYKIPGTYHAVIFFSDWGHYNPDPGSALVLLEN